MSAAHAGDSSGDTAVDAPPADFDVRPAGDGAVLVDCGDLGAALAMHEALSRAWGDGALRIDELVPAARTVLVRGRDAADHVAGRARIPFAEIWSAHAGSTARAAAPETPVEVPVVYDGADLDEVAQLTGLTAAEVIERHQAAEYTVAFTGFAPGFAYIAGGDPALQVPRRSSPRARIPAGSVGLAGPFSGVYPRESPGGWQLIGRTEVPMWDLDRDPPALLQPGTRVRFVAADRAADDDTDSADSAGSPLTGPVALTVRDAGLQCLVQDLGRPGLAHLGVSASGAADRAAHRRANRIVGNADAAAVLEIGIGEFAIRAERMLVIGLTGAPRTGSISGPTGARTIRMGTPTRIDAGEELRLGAAEAGLRTVLAIRGGVAARETLGSAATDTLAGLGPAPIASGDEVRVAGVESRSGSETPVRDGAAAEAAETEGLPRVGAEAVLRVRRGPRDDWFDESALTALGEQAWEVTPRSDRVGVRLAGDPLVRAPHARDVELPSEGLVRGAIQVPPDGQPVLFLADHPLTGGYPVIGVVVDADLDRAAQLPPGARVRFAALDGAETEGVIR
ncbi:allophanate hydrolase [Leucobacter sp. Psy1]|uniref:5-oxoprolinase subunit B/C family protein n=1 Tax=Leucobacter sp. Psy1 TaxID=2875729 RepID=UPI001CD69C79|nr:urea amidolyase family protein [Leucobacter sp. Psy1]UBH04929.1 allophanate hydrolase [Leucobacter sp. Psy1]